MTDIWTPSGLLGIEERAAVRAVEEYDPDLTLGMDMRNKNYVVLLKTGGPEGQPFPVFGLGTRLPSPDEITRRLYEADVRRHGGKIAQQLEKRNEARRKELELRADEGTQAAAEAYEWAFRKLGAHPFPRIFVPGGK